MFEIVSSLSLHGNPQKPNEDLFGSQGRTFWIIDGATGLGKRPYVAQNGQTDASWLAQKMHEAFALLSSPGIPFLGGPFFYQRAREIILKDFNEQAVETPEFDYAFPSASVARATLDEDCLICDSLGDCTILLRRKDGGIDAHRVDPVMSQCERDALARLVELRKSGQISVDMDPLDARTRLLPVIQENRSKANKPDGYGYFTLSTPILPVLVRTSFFNAANLSHILLMTDGFYTIVEDYAVMTDEELFSTVLSDGIDAVAKRLRSVENSDPKGQTYPRFKKNDDATAGLIRISL